MAEEKKYILDGYRFNDSNSYEQARRELNKIAEIKAAKDLKDEVELRAVYDSLVESEEFITPVGIGFLREAQKRLVKNPEQRKTMKAIPYYANEGIQEEKNTDKIVNKITVDEDIDSKSNNPEGDFDLINNFKQKLRNYRIVVAFLAIIALVPFGVLAYDKIFSGNAAEEALVNEYASWKEELTKKEQELNERERLFEGITDQKINSEMNTNGEENGESQNSGG